jgi:hypothetical protein
VSANFSSFQPSTNWRKKNFRYENYKWKVYSLTIHWTSLNFTTNNCNQHSINASNDDAFKNSSLIQLILIKHITMSLGKAFHSVSRYDSANKCFPQRLTNTCAQLEKSSRSPKWLSENQKSSFVRCFISKLFLKVFWNIFSMKWNMSFLMYYAFDILFNIPMFIFIIFIISQVHSLLIFFIKSSSDFPLSWVINL